MSYVYSYPNIFVNEINSGNTANDGEGDPLRTAFWKLFANDSGISGHLEHISGSVVTIGNRVDDAGIKKVTHYTTGNLNSGEYADISFTQGTSASKNGKFEVDLTESHYGTGTPYSSRSDILYSGGAVFHPGGFGNFTQWRTDFPVDKIGNPFNSGELDYTVRVVNSGNASNAQAPLVRITRTSDPINEAVSGADRTDQYGQSYHKLHIRLTEY
ncbi:MAG: hypothetical protein CMD25_04125 [Flavobacteriales bacterium]|nr:hypothetical protein [Flavobacteriales bacterium]|tara:strand:+ start:4453 stop:5094 length:642 start_codon:yes stop_codon:yes gene_type:complete